MKHNFSERLAALGRHLSDATILMHEAIARSAGLTGVDHKYLGILLKHGAMTAGELAALSGLTTGAVTGLVDRLEEKGLVRRVADKTDRRKVTVVPEVEAAKKLFERTNADLKKKMTELTERFSAEELDIVERYINGAVAVMETVTHKLNNQ